MVNESCVRFSRRLPSCSSKALTATTFILAAGCMCLIIFSSCARYIDPNVPEPIHPLAEPQLGRDYLLYRPSSYDRNVSWPLIVVCHAGFPDSPNRQLRYWTQLAESRGFVVVAPTLRNLRTSKMRRQDQTSAAGRSDVDHILAVVRHVRAGHNISTDRIFVYGWASGANAAIRAGLQHPELFRALAVLQPRVDTEQLSDVCNAIDHYQPVQVSYALVDVLTGKHARECVDWMRSSGVNVRIDSTGPTRPTNTDRAIEFFEDVIRTQPWVRLRAFPADKNNPLHIQFKLTCSYEPVRYQWDFGDGDESPVAAPIHTYQARGTYRVSVTIDGSNGRRDQRVVNLSVPTGTLLLPPPTDEN